MGLWAGGGGGWSGPWVVGGDDRVGGFALVRGYEPGTAGAGDSGKQGYSAGNDDDGSQDAAVEFDDVDCEHDERTGWSGGDAEGSREKAAKRRRPCVA